MSKAKANAKRTAAASKPRKSAAATRSPAKAGANAKPAATAKGPSGETGSRAVDARIRALGDWRGETLAEVRRMIREVAPDIVEDCKWVKASNPLGVPVWSLAGIVCTGEAYQKAVKLTFARGASLDDPHRLFNSSLEGGTRRAIDIREGDELKPRPFEALIQAAIAENRRSTGAD